MYVKVINKHTNMINVITDKYMKMLILGLRDAAAAAHQPRGLAICIIVILIVIIIIIIIIIVVVVILIAMIIIEDSLLRAFPIAGAPTPYCNML